MLSLLQASRFFAAAIVVLDHATVTSGMTRYYDRALLDGLFGAGRYGVDFFFVLSGFIICYAHWDDVKPRPGPLPGTALADDAGRGTVGTAARLTRFAKRRFIRIYPVYWVALLLTLLPLYVADNRYEGDIQSPWYLLSVFTLAQGNGNILTSAWTLSHEVLFYILFGLVVWRRNLGIVLLAGWFALSALSFSIAFPYRLLAHPEHLGFLAGMVGCYLVRTTRIPVPRAMFLMGLAGFAACCVLSGYVHVAADLNEIWHDPAARGPLVPLFLFSMMIVIGLVEMERTYGVSAPRSLRFLGDASYAIYLVHFQVVVVLIKVAYAAGATRFVPFWLLFFTICAMAIVAGVVFHVVVEKPLLTLANRLLGTRRNAMPAAVPAHHGHGRQA